MSHATGQWSNAQQSLQQNVKSRPQSEWNPAVGRELCISKCPQTCMNWSNGLKKSEPHWCQTLIKSQKNISSRYCCKMWFYKLLNHRVVFHRTARESWQKNVSFRYNVWLTGYNLSFSNMRDYCFKATFFFHSHTIFSQPCLSSFQCLSVTSDSE